MYFTLNHSSTLMRIITLFLLLLPLRPFAQIAESHVVETNSMKVVFNSNGALFTDFQKGGFVAPYQPGQAEHSLIRMAGLWMAGLDAAGNLRGAVQLYNEGGQGDFTPGLPDGTLNHIWRVTRDEVQWHNIDLHDDDEIDFPLHNIYAWPGKGNPYFEQYNPGQAPLPNNQLIAPFLDYNYDQSYNPDAGDSPYLVLPSCGIIAPPEELLWFPFHSGTQATESGLAPLPVDVYCTVVIRDCSFDKRVNNTVFIHYVLINRSAEPLHDIYAGMFNDFDIGNPDDDFFGCDTTRSLVYAYNGDALDEGGYGAFPPAVGVDLLAGPADADGHPLPIRCVLPVDPAAFTAPVQYYHVLKGLNPDGSPAQQNGFYYPTDLESGAGFSEVQAQNAPGNRKVLFSAGPFDLAPGAINQMTVAYTFGVGDGGVFSGLAEVLAHDQEIQYFFDECLTFHDGPDCLNLLSAHEAPEKQAFDLLPNPSTDRFCIRARETPFQHVTVKDQTGRVVWERTWQDPVQQAEVDTRKFLAGMYTVLISTARREVAAQRMILVR